MGARYLLAVIAATVMLVAAPTAAQGFVGEEHVINPGTGKLTTPAETILTNPTFLEEFEGVAPGPKRTGLLKTLMGSRALPMIGRVLPVVGAAWAAVEVCNAVMSGCLSFEKHPEAFTVEGSWTWTNRGSESALDGVKTGPMVYYWGPSTYSFRGKGGVPTDCTSGSNWPGSATHAALGTKPAAINCGGSYGIINAYRSYALRWPGGWSVNYGGGTGSALSGSNYCRGWGASDACATSADASGWSKEAATGLAQHVDPDVGQWVAAKVAPGEVKDPFKTFVGVPSCSGEAWTECKEQLEELELVPERATLTWETAHLDVAGEGVTEMNPVPGTEVETGTKVVVTTNPPTEEMPLVVPQPEEGDTYDDYIARLAPGLDPERTIVEESFIDPDAGPDAVLRVLPKPGTRWAPGTTTSITVQTNPPTAPAGGFGWSPPPMPSIDMSPIAGIGSPCSVFPFGLLCWFGDVLGQFNTEGKCPDMAVEVAEDADFELTLCGEVSDQLLSYLRPLLLVAWTVGCGFLFARATRAVGGD